MENGWAWVKRELNAITPSYFIPSFFSIDPARYRHMPALDGVFNVSATDSTIPYLSDGLNSGMEGGPLI